MARRLDGTDLMVVAASLAVVGASLLVDFSPGLVTGFSPTGAPHFNKELQSSGSDDDVLLYLAAAGLVLLLPLFLWPLGRRGSVLKVSLLTAVAVLQFSVGFLTPEVGSLWLTLTSGANPTVFVWLVVLVARCQRTPRSWSSSRPIRSAARKLSISARTSSCCATRRSNSSPAAPQLARTSVTRALTEHPLLFARSCARR